MARQVKITGGTPGAGKVLTSDAGGLASWQTPAGGGGGEWELIKTKNVVGQKYIEFTAGIDSTYERYKLELDKISVDTPIGINERLLLQVGTGVGPTWQTSGDYDYRDIGNNAGPFESELSGYNSPFIILIPFTDLKPTGYLAGTILMFYPADTSLQTGFKWDLIYAPTDVATNIIGAGIYDELTAVTAVRLYASGSASSGNFDKGTVSLYGWLGN